MTFNMPELVTLTGASDDTNVDDLLGLVQEYDFLELGILYSKSQNGNGDRYPSIKWMIDFFDIVAQKNIEANIALHICGSAVHDFIVDGAIPFVNANPLVSMRYQLNFNRHAALFTIDDLRNAIANVDEPVITQHNEKNASICDHSMPHNHQILFDGSGGRGISPTQWQPQLPEKICGYAGGIGPDNVTDVISVVGQIANPYWIDMENKVRTGSSFDLVKCHQVLQLVRNQANLRQQLEELNVDVNLIGS